MCRSSLNCNNNLVVCAGRIAEFCCVKVDIALDLFSGGLGEIVDDTICVVDIIFVGTGST